jgi:glycosyltransferase involved in cell wall biosynthesis
MLIARDMPPLLSVVIPLFNEEKVFPLLKAELQRIRPAWVCPTEIVLVDDGSSDGTFPLMHSWSLEDSSVKAISLSRNFGHQIAVTAGLDAACGTAIVIMDADLQDPPAVVGDMLRGYCLGYDVVYGQRVERRDESLFKRFTAKIFYWVMRTCVDARLPDNVGDFRLVTRRVVEDLRRMSERDRFLRGMVAWVGYHQLAVPYVRPGRVAGETKYPFWKMLKFAITAITAFSDVPLRLVTWLGIGSLGLSVFLIVRTLWLYFFSDVQLVLGWTSLTILLCLFSGLILVSLGLVGLYIGKIFVESQHRPLYLVRHAGNIKGNPFR